MENEELKEAAPVAAEPAAPAAEPVAEVAPAAEPVAETITVTAPVESESSSEESAPAEVREERKPRQFLEVTQEMLDDCSHRLSVMLDYLALEGTVRAEKRNGRVSLLVSSSDAGRIIGRKGLSLESLQLLLNRMVQKINIDYPRVTIDIDGYPAKEGGEHRHHSFHDREDRGPRTRRPREDRGEHSPRPHRSFEEGGSDKEEMLRQQALDTAKEVRRWGEPVTLPPMNSHDRRIIHITLEKEADLSTESSGEGAMKSVVIALKKQD